MNRLCERPYGTFLLPTVNLSDMVDALAMCSIGISEKAHNGQRRKLKKSEKVWVLLKTLVNHPDVASLTSLHNAGVWTEQEVWYFVLIRITVLLK